MSQTDIENVKAGFDAYNDGNFERLLELWEEDVEIVGLLVGNPCVERRRLVAGWCRKRSTSAASRLSFAIWRARARHLRTGTSTGGEAAWT